MAQISQWLAVVPTQRHEVRVISNAASPGRSLGGLCVERSRKRAELGLQQAVGERCLERYRERSHTERP